MFQFGLDIDTFQWPAKSRFVLRIFKHIFEGFIANLLLNSVK